MDSGNASIEDAKGAVRDVSSFVSGIDEDSMPMEDASNVDKEIVPDGDIEGIASDVGSAVSEIDEGCMLSEGA